MILNRVLAAGCLLPLLSLTATLPAHAQVAGGNVVSAFTGSSTYGELLSAGPGKVLVVSRADDVPVNQVYLLRPGTTPVLLSSNAAGVAADQAASDPHESPNGSSVVFSSKASNLIPGVSGQQLWLKDMFTGQVKLVSSSSSGAPAVDTAAPDAAARSSFEGFSPDGSKVMFSSTANNLVPGDVNYRTDTFVKDLSSGVTTMVASTPTEIANQPSSHFAFSPESRFVFFDSTASNLRPGDTEFTNEVFAKDLSTGALRAVSRTPGGVFTTGSLALADDDNLPHATPDGRMLLWDSSEVGSDVKLYGYSLTDDAVTVVAQSDSGVSGYARSANRLWVRAKVDYVNNLFITNNPTPVYTPSTASEGVSQIVKATDTLAVIRRTVGTSSSQLAAVRVNDAGVVQSNQVVSQTAAGVVGNYAATLLQLSDDTQQVMFVSKSNNLMPPGQSDYNGKDDVFVKDLTSGALVPVSVTPQGATVNEATEDAALSPSGKLVVFKSNAPNLTPEDTNGTVTDVFVKDLSTSSVRVLARSAFGVQSDVPASEPQWLGNDRVAFSTVGATTIDPNDVTTGYRVWVKDLTVADKAFSYTSKVVRSRWALRLDVASAHVGQVKVSSGSWSRMVNLNDSSARTQKVWVPLPASGKYSVTLAYADRTAVVAGKVRPPKALPSRKTVKVSYRTVTRQVKGKKVNRKVAVVRSTATLPTGDRLQVRAKGSKPVVVKRGKAVVPRKPARVVWVRSGSDASMVTPVTRIHR